MSSRPRCARPYAAVVAEFDLTRVGDSIGQANFDQRFRRRIEAVDRVVVRATDPDSAMFEPCPRTAETLSPRLNFRQLQLDER